MPSDTTSDTEEPPPDSTPDRMGSTPDRSDSTSDRSGFTRRPLLKALGAGATLSLASGPTAAATAEQDEAQIDPRFGYVAPDAGEIPANLQPAHEVQLVVAPPDPAAGQPPSFSFEPSGLHVSAGDVVQFTFTTPDHTVTAYHPATGFQQRVPDGVPPFSSPSVNAGGAWLYRFDAAGVYDVYCGPHHVFGMSMRLVAGDVGEDDAPDYVDTFEGSENPPILAPYSREMMEGELDAFSDRNQNTEWVWLTPREVLATDALAPDRIQDEGAVSHSAVREELGRGGGETTTE